jgi:hypothetical protein
MNVMHLGAVPAPLPTVLQVRRAAAAERSPDAGARHASEHGAPAKRAEPEAPELPPLKPVSKDEFRVMLGALPASALRRSAGRLDIYV